MSLTRKFIVSLVLSIFFIASINILGFYVFYTSYLKVYLVEKISSKEVVTLEYINNIVKKQTIDDIDSIFTDAEIVFFELLENSWGQISLNEQQNIDIVINYLVKNGIAPKYIEEIIPTDNFWKVLEAIKDKNSPEYKFLNKLTISIIIMNILSILIIIFSLLIFIRKSILPIKSVTESIKELSHLKKFEYSKKYEEIVYHNKKDEIGLLISAINKLNKKLQLQEEIKSRLLADISHELKTPITSIQCYLEGISDGIIKLNQKNLNAITDEMSRLISLVNKIMDFERSENKKLDLVLADTDIDSTIKLIVETHKKRLKENKQRIKVTGEWELIIPVDEDLFKQLAHNLIWNFLKYAWKNTTLKIILWKKYIEFTDDGKGIKSSEVPFLTEKFYQGKIEKSWDIDKRGIWVWLSIIAKIIDSHWWKFDIKSDSEKGFSFKIFFT